MVGFSVCILDVEVDLFVMELFLQVPALSQTCDLNLLMFFILRFDLVLVGDY